MFLKIIKSKTTVGFRSAVKNLSEEFKIQGIHRASLRQVTRYIDMYRGNLKLNIGCGSNLKLGWINIDLADRADLQLDLREPLPFAAESVLQIYSEHFFEHLEFPDQALDFLKESLRILQPKGLFSIVVPDTEWPLKSYVNQDEEYFLVARKLWHPKWCNTRMHNLNYHFRQGSEHKYAYDFETLSQILREMGFIDILRRSFNPALDDESRSIGSLYVDAFKPVSQSVDEAR